MREYTVDLSNASSWGDFVEALNVGFVRHFGGEWKGSLDAFNDYLWWPDEHPYRLIVRGWSGFEGKAKSHRTWDGRPVLEVIQEIFADNPQTQVRFE